MEKKSTTVSLYAIGENIYNSDTIVALGIEHNVEYSFIDIQMIDLNDGYFLIAYNDGGVGEILKKVSEGTYTTICAFDLTKLKQLTA